MAKWRSNSTWRGPTTTPSSPPRPDRRYLQKDQRRRGPSWRLWLFLVLAAWAGYTVLAGPQGLVQLMEIQGYERDLERQVAQLEGQLDSLRAIQENLDNCGFLREKTAREVYGMARDDELIYYIETDPPPPLPEPPEVEGVDGLQVPGGAPAPLEFGKPMEEPAGDD
ncbi:MAG: hypothetical protein GF355_01640 [Candidatus Eisenbacteria bacterium]|nr:hypothetical protein [Candidatus Eisenbacteria bacterium]